MKGMLFSGGTESTLLMNKLLQENNDIFAIYIRFGFEWEEAELNHASKIIEYYKKYHTDRSIKFQVIDARNVVPVRSLGKVKSIKDNIIPLRNLNLITIATNVLVYHNIYTLSLGAVYIPGYPDLSEEYFKLLEEVINKGLLENKFKIELPFFYLSKDEILKKYSSGAPIDLIFSCANPVNGKMCGECYKCVSLKEAKKKVNIYEKK